MAFYEVDKEIIEVIEGVKRFHLFYGNMEPFLLPVGTTSKFKNNEVCKMEFRGNNDNWLSVNNTGKGTVDIWYQSLLHFGIDKYMSIPYDLFRDSFVDFLNKFDENKFNIEKINGI